MDLGTVVKLVFAFVSPTGVNVSDSCQDASQAYLDQLTNVRTSTWELNHCKVISNYN